MVEVLAQAARGLAAVHAAGVVHRDLKPANLLLEATGEERPHVRLTDFGVAAARDQPRLTRTTDVVGSPGYLAPEQESGADPDPAQDVFALGACGLEMLTGVRPPAARAAAVTLAERDPGQRPLVSLLLATTDRDPAGRPAGAGELERLLREVPLAADPDGERPCVFDQVPVVPPGAAPDSSASGVPLSPRPATRSGRAVGPRRAGWLLLGVGLLCALLALGLLLA